MANEKRLIEVTPLIDECKECMNIEWNKIVYTTWAEAEEDFMQRLLDAPTVDAAPVVHGWWKRRGRNLGECSECGEIVMVRYPYCPNCGAKMDLKEE